MEKLVQNAQELFNVHLTGRQVIALTTYERELIEWNQKFNLTAIRDKAGIRTKHFLDSFSCVAAWGSSPPTNPEAPAPRLHRIAAGRRSAARPTTTRAPK